MSTKLTLSVCLVMQNCYYIIMVYYKKSHKTILTVLLSLIFICAFTIIAIVIVSISRAPSPAPAAQPSITTAKGGSGGGNKSVTPPDFPVDFPLPSGTITGSTGSSPSWSIGLNMSGGYALVMASLRPFYVERGFKDLDSNAVIPTRFENNIYTASLVGRSHDHSNTSADIVVIVRKK